MKINEITKLRKMNDYTIQMSEYAEQIKHLPQAYQYVWCCRLYYRV